MKTKPTLFISRSVKEDSPLWSIQDMVNIIGHSLLNIEPVPFSNVPKMPFLFFYSSNGVRNFFEQLDARQFTLATQKQLGTMGEGTAATLQRYIGRAADFIGNGDATYAAQYIQEAQLHTCFIQASNSRESVALLLPTDLYDTLVVYENKKKIGTAIPQADIYVITSPLNAEVFMEMACCRYHMKVIAIGHTTQQKLIDLGYMLSICPEEPSEPSIVELIKSLLHES